MKKMKIIHIIIGLETGGAELMLKRLIQAHKEDLNYTHIVISLTGLGKVGIQLKTLGIEVHALDMRSPFEIPYVLWQLIRLMRSKAPQIIQTWMYHADLIGGLIAKLLFIKKVYWNIRNSTLDISKTKWLTLVVLKICSMKLFLDLHLIKNKANK